MLQKRMWLTIIVSLKFALDIGRLVKFNNATGLMNTIVLGIHLMIEMFCMIGTKNELNVAYQLLS